MPRNLQSGTTFSKSLFRMRKLYFSLLLAFTSLFLSAQIVINEASNRNYTQSSEDGENYYDWFEMYNTSAVPVNIGNWGITDDKNIPVKWKFPNYSLDSGQFQIVYASGLDIKYVSILNHWESAVLPTDTFRYVEPTAELPGWNGIGFDDSSWGKGAAGFGFGDNDDNTILNTSSVAVYIRRDFNITDKNVITRAILHIDYDDGFIAYLNGVEIARMNIGGTPAWNGTASTTHEAVMYQGGNPEKFELDTSLIRSILLNGQNVLAIEVHNVQASSTDLSLIPFLSFGILSAESLFQPVPGWFSETTGIRLHTNFKLDSQGENLYLSTPDSTIVDSLIIPRIPLNCSFGRVTDGAVNCGIFENATPGSSNNTSQAYTKGYEPAPKFDIAAGFYNSTVKVTISDTSATGQIRFTTDGSEPTVTSNLYKGTPVSIVSTKTLKAKCFSTTDKLSSSTETATYFINVNHTIPVISITTNNENLYGSSGIFDNIDASWNKPCYIEYFDGDNKLAFKQEAGIQIDGGAGGSRTQPQHSVRIEPGNGTFGAGNVNYKLIPDRPNREKYSSFYLRNGSNQYNTLQYKDGIQVKSVAKNTYAYYSAYTPIVAYINGNYFGVYELREKLNADFFTENYLMNNDSLDILTLSYYKGQVLEALEGSTDPFWKDFNKFRSLSPSANDYQSRVDSFLDLNNYTDYIIAQSWIGNTDWPFNNIRIIRNKSTNFRWQFAVLDVEWSMLPNGWNSATDDHIGYMLSQSSDLPYIGFWLGLIQNKAYKISFINRFADLMNTNYLFSVIGPMEQEIYDYIYPEMGREFSRWGNSDMISFRNNHNTLRDQFSIRSGYVRQHIQSRFGCSGQVEVTLDVKPEGAGQIKISTITPTDYPWNGIYFDGIPVKITAVPNPGYKFANWDDNSLISNPDTNSAIVTMSSSAENFTANFEASKDDFRGVTISEIHYKNGTNENSSDWIEIYNAADSAISLKGWYFTDKDSINKYSFNNSTILNANSRLVVVRDIMAFKANHPDVKNLTGPFNFKLGAPVDAVRLYDSSKALIAEVNYSDIYPWPLNGDENGRTLELRNPAGDLSDPANWFAGCIGGSPGQAYTQCPPVVVGTDEITMISKSSIQAYPVPAHEFVNLSIDIEWSSNNSILKIYNSIGCEVKTIKYGRVYKGTFFTAVDLSDIPDGLLIIEFQADNIQKNIKIIHLSN